MGLRLLVFHIVVLLTLLACRVRLAARPRGRGGHGRAAPVPGLGRQGAVYVALSDLT